MKVIIRDFYTCQRCGKSPGINGLQIAHRIKSGSGTMEYVKNYLFYCGDRWTKPLTDKEITNKIIDHPLNLVTTCSLAHNDSYNIFNNPIERDKLLEEILSDLLVDV